MFLGVLHRSKPNSVPGLKRALSSRAARISIRRDLGPYVGGGSFMKGEGAPISIECPATSTTIVEVSTPSPAQAEAVLAQAQAAHDSGIWSRASHVHRSRTMQRFAELLSENVPRLAEMESLQTGRPVRELRAQLSRLPAWLEYYAALLRSQNFGSIVPTEGALLNYVQRQPLGVVVQISSFNHPLLIALKKIAPALAAGNAIIAKPSELTPITLLEVALLATQAGIPDGILCVLPGEGITLGKQLVGDRRVKKVDLTGGTSTGRAIGSIVGGNLASFTAELGGKAPVVVFADCDLENAVAGVCFASFIATGQTCVSATRILVQDSIYQEFLAKLKAKVATIEKRMGDPLNPDSMMGPLISSPQLDKSIEIIADSRSYGLTIETGGERLSRSSELDGFDLSSGYFFPPTVVSGTDIVQSRLWREEIFGPVIAIAKFSSEAEAVRLANDCDFGLGAGIWTSNGARGIRVAAALESGVIWINSHHRNDPSSPWGGMKDSGIGRENGVEAYHAYSTTKSEYFLPSVHGNWLIPFVLEPGVIMNTASEEETRATDDWFGEKKDARYG